MALEVKLRKRLQSFRVDVSFRVKGGHLLALVGPSGAGKTTIIRMIAGLERPDEGFIAYDGEIWVDSVRKIFLRPQKRSLGFVFQDYTLFPHLSVWRNAVFAARKKEQAKELLNLFGIWHLRNAAPHRISGGERQRCAICQNLAREPKVLLLDEPFSSLDVENRRRLRREMKRLKERLSLPMVHVTHDLWEALYLGDEVLPIVQGRIEPGWLQRQFREDQEEKGFQLWLTHGGRLKRKIPSS